MDDRAIITALVGLASAVVGGLLNAYFQRRSQSVDFSRKAKRDFYDGLLDHLWESNLSPDMDSRKFHAAEFLKKSTKIAIYGSDLVVSRMAEVVTITNLYDPNDQAKISRLIAAMRADLGGSADTEIESAIRRIVFDRPNRNHSSGISE